MGKFDLGKLPAKTRSCLTTEAVMAVIGKDSVSVVGAACLTAP